ncbi:MAG TPA: putative sulfate exporter family transporter [Candidatus Eisenbacteria bacterium]|nr:putative sulfate exporter family transporter [Candidatus Eisenbacteria bacterium]
MLSTRSFATLLPGLLLAVGVALTARLLHGFLPPAVGTALGEVIVAVLLGLAIGNLVPLSGATAPGVRFSFHTVLRTAIVLLGATFSFAQVVAIGGKALLMIVALMLLALAVAHALGRAAGTPGRLATLIGVGTAVCGNSAIVATAPVIGARDDEVSFAIATNTLFGTLAVFLYPFIGHALGMSDAVFGTWAGTAVNDTSQVVAAGFAYSEAAGKVATAVKLTRNALMGGVIVAMGLVYSRSLAATAAGAGGAAAGSSTWLKRLKQSLPLFVIGFLVLALLNTIGAVRALSDATGRDIPKLLQLIVKFLILVALAGVGLSTRFEAMRKTGVRPFYVGLATAAATATASFFIIQWFGPAAG